MVEWKKLGEVIKVHTGDQLNRADMLDDGLYPVVNGGRDYSGYTEKYNEEANTITISQGGESAGFVNWIDVRFWAGAHCYVIEETDSFDKRFLYHSLKNKEREFQTSKQGAGIPGLNRSTLYNQIIPVPSISEQQRTVEQLDTFTSSIDNLKQQIAQRRKQYEYYRDQLLDLEGKEGVEMKTLGEIGDVCMCKRIMKDQTSDNGEIPFYKIGTFGGKADAFITKELFKEYKSKYSYPKLGEILISASGTIGRSVVFDGEDAYFQDSNIVWIANDEKLVTNRYLYYFYQIAEWKTDGGTIKRLYNYNLKNTSIPVPSLSEQTRIVSILDTFETSIQNLEAQLKQREKQYEYYRNKLLTFE